MVDEQDGAERSAGLTPEQDAAVRRLVAEARHDEPIPEAVATRLDKVLAHLATDSGANAETVVVADLDTRRRRRTAGRLLLAAAAVVVGGFAVGQVLGDGGLSPSADDAGAGADTEQSAERDASAADADQPEDGVAPESAPTTPDELSGGNGEAALDDQYAALRREVPVNLSEGSFARDVRRVYKDAALARNAGASQSLVDEARPFACPEAAYGEGLLLPAYLDGQPTVLAFRPPVGSRRVAVLLECGTAEALDQLTLTYNKGN